MSSRRAPLRSAFAAALVLAAMPSSAFAQSASPAAEALFNAGREAAKAGDHKTACEKFGESQRLEPAAGTLLNLAQCTAKLGQLARAWQMYTEVVRLLPPDDKRREYAQKELDAVNAKVAWVTLKPTASAPKDMVAQHGDVELGYAGLGVAFPVDPGELVVTVKAPGYAERVYRLAFVEGQRAEHEIEPGARTEIYDAAPPVAPPPPPPPPRAAAPPRPPPAPPPERSSSLRTVGWIGVGLGGAGIVFGAVTGLVAAGKRSDFDTLCFEDRCPESARSDVDAYDSMRTLSTVGFVAGAALVLGGAGLVLFAPRTGGTAVAVRTRGPGAAVEGAF